MNEKDKIVFKLIAGIHLLALGAPFFYTPGAFKLMVIGYIISAMSITTSYHRQLTHRSFETDKWLERFFAFIAVLAI